MTDGNFFDIERFLAHTGNDESFAREIAQESIRVMPDYLNQIYTALTAGDALLIKKAAHKYKGGMRTICAASAADIAEQIEHNAASGDIPSCLALKASLESAAAETTRAIETFLKQSTVSGT
jgi:HPt (histidine-containing phosphotransfer) domain-containing protein